MRAVIQLQVSADQPGNKVLKSTVLSQKAMYEQQQQRLVEAKKKQAMEAMRVRNELQAKKQNELQAKKQNELMGMKLEAKRQLEEKARIAALQAKEQEKVSYLYRSLAVRGSKNIWDLDGCFSVLCFTVSWLHIELKDFHVVVISWGCWLEIVIKIILTTFTKGIYVY